MNPKRLLASWLLLVPLAACDDKNPGFWQPKNRLLPAVALDNRVAFVEANSKTAYVVDPGDPAFRPQMVAVGEAPILAVKHNAKNELLVLSRGNPGSAAKAPVAAQLQVIDATLTLPPVNYPLSGSFDGLAQSDDGAFAILYRTSAKGSATDSTLYNPNELTIIDFSLPAPIPRSIRSLGDSPSGILFSPPLNFRSGSRTLAVVLAQNYITILDLANPHNNEISIPLCAQTSGCTFKPDQVLFDPNPVPGSEPTSPRSFNLFVRDADSSDVFQIALTELPAGTVPVGLANNFTPALSMLGVGSSAADMALFSTDQGTRLLVAAPNARSLLVIDPKTTNTTTVPTTIPVDTIITFTLTTSPGKSEALLLDKSRGSRTATFAKLDMLETAGAGALIDRPLQAAASKVEVLAAENTVLVTYGSSGGNVALAVVDLTSQSVSPMSTNTSMTSTTIDRRSPSRMWGAVPGAKLLYLDLTARANEARLYGTVWLDQAITSILPLAAPSSIDGRHYLVLGHNDPDGIGNVTLVDADKPDRATARTAYGFLFSNYLDRGQP